MKPLSGVILHFFVYSIYIYKFVTQVHGFVDIIALFKLFKPGLSSYCETNLFKHLLDKSYESHDASKM